MRLSRLVGTRPRSIRRTTLQLHHMEDRLAPSATLQVIHNSPYAIAAQVDVYVNDTLLIDNFAFGTAKTFSGLPAGSYDIDITTSDAPNNANPVFSTVVNLAADTRYIAVAAGDPLAVPGSATAFNLEAFAPAQVSAAAGTVNVLAFHGAPDAPEVDVRARGVGTLVDGFEFRDFAGYLNVPSADYILDVTLPDGTIVRSFAAPLTATPGLAVTVLATGFVVPPPNSSNAFGLLAVLPDDTAITLPVVAALVEGTAGNDLINVRESKGVISVSVNNAAPTRFLAATNTLTVDAGAGNDLINATWARADLRLLGGVGRDLILGGWGNDFIDGGADNDLLIGNAGNDTIRGGAGNDVLIGGPGQDDVDGQDGFDIAIG